MNWRTRFAVAGMAAVVPLVTGLLAVREPAALLAAPAGGAVAPETELLIAHALGVAIDGATTHRTARAIATLPDRKKDEAKGALEAMRKSARTAYQDSDKLFTEAQKRLANYAGDAAARPLYGAAIAYTKTMWQLTGEATPTDETKQETKPTGELSIDDLATLDSINQTVRSAVGAFLLKQLAARAKSPGNSSIVALDDHAGAMAKASKEASASFPGVAGELLAEAKAKLDAAEQEKAAAKQEKAAAKAIEKVAKRLQSRAATAEAKGTKEHAKQAKKDAGEKAKAAKKAQKKAEKAQAKEIGEDARPSVQKLGRQGRTIILLLDRVVEGPESSK